MPSSTNKKGGKKFGRVKDKPCHKRYNEQSRWVKNRIFKAGRIARMMKKFPKYQPFNLESSMREMVDILLA